MRPFRHYLVPLDLLLLVMSAFGGSVESYAEKIAPLIAPSKLATLGVRGANPRVQKIVYWLAEAKRENIDSVKVADVSVQRAGYTNSQAANLTKDELGLPAASGGEIL